MGRPGEDAAKAENKSSTANESSALGSYNDSMDQYMSNVNSQLAQGNPYESKAYKTEQNLATSGAMHAQNDAATTQLRDTAARTGQNAASVNAAVSQNARMGQQTVDRYNADRDSANEDKYLQYEQGLTHDQLEGANSRAGMVGTMAGQQSASVGALTNEDQQQRQEWESYIQDAASAGGSAAAV